MIGVGGAPYGEHRHCWQRTWSLAHIAHAVAEHQVKIVGATSAFAWKLETRQVRPAVVHQLLKVRLERVEAREGLHRLRAIAQDHKVQFQTRPILPYCL